jgi:glucose-6-phosphate 1-dehydrogenase
MEQSAASSLELKDNTVIVVLGASGDLAKKKTFPALFGLVSIPQRQGEQALIDE